jgi:hypothetical protein
MIEVDVLGLEVFLQPVRAQLAADAGLFEPPSWAAAAEVTRVVTPIGTPLVAPPHAAAAET